MTRHPPGPPDPVDDAPLAPAGRRDPGRILWIWVAYALLYGLSIPWYLPRHDTVPTWFGLPYWVVISLAATLGVAAFTAVVLDRYWSSDATSDSVDRHSAPDQPQP